MIVRYYTWLVVFAISGLLSTVMPVVDPSNSPSNAPTTAPSRLRSSTNIIATLMGTGVGASSGTGGPATAATMYQPESVFRDTQGTFYVSEFEGNCLRKFSSTSNYIVISVAGVCGASISFPATSVATSAALGYPVDVVVSTTGIVYFADYYGWAVRAVSTSGILSVVAGASGYDTMQSGAATSVGLAYPYGVWLDSVGQLYVTNSFDSSSSSPNGCLVRKITASGYSTVIAGE